MDLDPEQFEIENESMYYNNQDDPNTIEQNNYIEKKRLKVKKGNQ